MFCFPRLRAPVIGWVLLTLVGSSTLSGCNIGRVGGSGSPGGADSLSLSAKEAAPGEFLTISHSSITEGTPVEVRFSGPGGFEVSTRITPVADGSVQIPVPPFLDPTTGASRSDEVAVSLGGISAAETLTIEDLPTMTELAPG